MWHVALKSLWARKFRLVTTSIAVLLGVAFMVGTSVLTSTMNKTFDDLFSDAFKNTDVVVRGPKTVEGGQGVEVDRAKIDESLREKVSTIPGVKYAVGEVDGQLTPLKKDGKPLSTGGAPAFGSVWNDVSANPFVLTEGRAPTADNEVVIDKMTATRTKYTVGESMPVVVDGVTKHVTISGIARFGSADSPAGASFTMFTLHAAQDLFGAPGKLTSVTVVGADGISQNELRDRIKAQMSPQIDVITGKELTKENQNTIKDALKFINYVLLFFVCISLFVGVFIIYNTFSILVAQRIKEMALLRALGASRRQVSRTILIEAFAVGLVAGGLGLLAGIGVAKGLKELFAAFGGELPATGLVVPLQTVITAFAVGVVVSMLSAWLPARRGGRVPPVAAMRDVSVDRSGASKKRLVFGAVLLALGVASVIVGLFADMPKPFILVGLGIPITFLGLAVLGPVIVGPVAVVIGALPSRFRGMPGKLATDNARRNPRRTSATASALMIGVGFVGLIVIMTTSLKASLYDVLDRSFSGDFVVTQQEAYGGSLPPELAQRVRQLPGVDGAAGFPFGIAMINGESEPVQAFDGAAARRVFDPDVKEGSVENLGKDGIAIGKKEAESRKLGLGAQLTVLSVDAPERTYTIKGIYKDATLIGPYVLSYEGFRAQFNKPMDGVVLVKLKDGANADQVREAIEKEGSIYPGLEVQDRGEFKDAFAKQVNQILLFVFALLALAIFIALIGIGNTLVLSIHERTREIGLLRAVGMSRRQLRSMIRWEAVIVAVFGTILGLVVAIFLGSSMVSSLKDEGITTLRIPLGSLATITVLGAVAGVLSALWPAWRASRLNVLAAIATE